MDSIATEIELLDDLMTTSGLIAINFAQRRDCRVIPAGIVNFNRIIAPPINTLHCANKPENRYQAPSKVIELIIRYYQK